MARRPTIPPAFSLIELVIVVVIVGVIAAIAVPRLTAASERVRLRQVEADAAALQRAADLYAAEHADRTPAHRPDGTVDTDAQSLIRRLLRRTTDTGSISPTGLFGPYLKSWPKNPFPVCRLVRIDGPAPPKNCAWRFDSATGRFTPDHTGVMEDCGMGHGLTPPEATLTPSELTVEAG